MENICSILTHRLFREVKKMMRIASLFLVAIAFAACAQTDHLDVEANQTPSGGDVQADVSASAPSQGDLPGSNQNDGQGKVEISMEEAISIGIKEAEKHYDGLCLTEIHSFDNDQTIDRSAGSDGKRQWWYVDFANEDNNYVSVLIADAQPVEVVCYDDNWNAGLIDLSSVALTSEDAVKKAQDMGLIGGNPENGVDWASGYHFKLQYASLMESPDDRKVFFEVIGISPNGNFAHVDLNAVTGECLLAEEKIEYDNGEVEWIKFD